MAVWGTIYDETAPDTTKPVAQYLSRDVRFQPNDAAIEELMRLFGHKQVKFWME